MFRILVIDDDPASAYLLREVMKDLHRQYELSFANDGLEALRLLNREGAHQNAPHPNLILLDLHMPRLSGLETLAAIKSTPALCAIPVIMLSTGGSPEDVRRSYEAHANCYVQKPIDLERFVKLVQAFEAFWMDFALLPSYGEWGPYSSQTIDSTMYKSTAGDTLAQSGPTIAQDLAEVSNRAMSHHTIAGETAAPARASGCEEHNGLLDEFGLSVRELLKLHEQQFRAIVDGDPECNRFDILIHMANEKKHLAKYAYLRHVESHGCSNIDALNKTGT